MNSKLLVSPLAWYLLSVLIGVLWLRRSTEGSSRRIANGMILLTLGTALAATPLMGNLLERSLRVDRRSVSGSTPEIIFVLGGGYSVGRSPAGDVLTTSTAERVLHGVNEWRMNKGARLIFSGRSGGQRGTELMARAAMGWGVPDSVFTLEPRSRNTREHPIEGLRLPGVSHTTHVAVVTSRYHMRRAAREFCRYFERLDVYPVPSLELGRTFRSVLPQAGTLSWNTLLLREWIGIAWYAIRGMGEEAVGDC